MYCKIGEGVGNNRMLYNPKCLFEKPQNDERETIFSVYYPIGCGIYTACVQRHMLNYDLNTFLWALTLSLVERLILAHLY